MIDSSSISICHAHAPPRRGICIYRAAGVRTCMGMEFEATRTLRYTLAIARLTLVM
jgi:hypothetical protein